MREFLLSLRADFNSFLFLINPTSELSLIGFFSVFVKATKASSKAQKRAFLVEALTFKATKLKSLSDEKNNFGLIFLKQTQQRNRLIRLVIFPSVSHTHWHYIPNINNNLVVKTR